MANGIDVSEWQGEIDWSRVRTDFAVLRAGYGRLTSQEDKYFQRNYDGCMAQNIPCGAYWYSYAVNPDEAVAEARACLDVIKNRRFAYPVYYDVEEERTFSSGRTAEIITAFLDTLEKSGYFAGLYMSRNALYEYTTDEIRRKYALWVADYSDEPDNIGMWQKSAEGTIDGINGNVDLDVAYEDYPEIIRGAGLNGFGRHTISVIIDGEFIIRDYDF